LRNYNSNQSNPVWFEDHARNSGQTNRNQPFI
jgi:hypothetical protein